MTDRSAADRAVHVAEAGKHKAQEELHNLKGEMYSDRAKNPHRGALDRLGDATHAAKEKVSEVLESGRKETEKEKAKGNI